MAKAKAEKAAADGCFKNLTVEGALTVKHPDDPGPGLVVSGTKNGAGIWVGDGKVYVTIQSINGCTYVGVASNTAKDGDAFAISIDKDGKPGIQLSVPGKACVQLDADQLGKIFC
jgi:hypothetical protein